MFVLTFALGVREAIMADSLQLIGKVLTPCVFHTLRSMAASFFAN
jgi:hypothetical protein